MEEHNVMYASTKSNDTERSAVKNYAKKQKHTTNKIKNRNTNTKSSIVCLWLSVQYVMYQYKIKSVK